MSAGVAAAPTIQSLAPGDALGRYELLLPLAQGGMATVWAARMKGTRGFSKIVAIKTMLPALSTDPRFEKMFLAEAELASRIKHPNVCEILDLGEQDGVLYLVMEWIDGESLLTLLSDCERAGRRIPFAAAARIGADAARGLHAAHELKDEGGALAGVVHRDVSPHNILVTYDGVVKIVDFGVARAVARTDQQATSAGHLKGKVHFMAPEQAFCDQIDRRTDVFALGIVLYQLTTGQHPFRADNELATLARITSPAPVPAPSTLVPDYPPALAAVVLKALAKERDARFGTMRELADALDAVAIDLAEPAGMKGIEAFVHAALDPRREVRSAQIKEARRAADEREEQRTLEGVTSPLAGIVGVEATPSRAAGDAAEAPRPRARSLAGAAGLVSLGAILGAVALVWATRGAPTLAGGASAPSATLAPTVAPGPPPGVVLAASPELAIAAPAPSAATPMASPTTSTTSTTSTTAPTSRPIVKIAPATPKSPSAGKFRNPGF